MKYSIHPMIHPIHFNSIFIQFILFFLYSTKMLANGDTRKDGFSKSKVGSCGVCSLGVMASSVLCVQCGKWIGS